MIFSGCVMEIQRNHKVVLAVSKNLCYNWIISKFPLKLRGGVPPCGGEPVVLAGTLCFPHVGGGVILRFPDIGEILLRIFVIPSPSFHRRLCDVFQPN